MSQDAVLREAERLSRTDPVARRLWRWRRWRAGGEFYELGERVAWRCPRWYEWKHNSQPQAEQTYYACVSHVGGPLNEPACNKPGPRMVGTVVRAPDDRYATTHPRERICIVFDEAPAHRGDPLTWELDIVLRWQEFEDA